MRGDRPQHPGGTHRPGPAALAALGTGGDPPRPATPRLRSPLAPMVATRRARLRRACDRH
ncbi:hypothetical protein B8W69_25190 [Mycobacterium vulneris]|uniref:Uncharacterized protein n=1 Tax=Mycolicibacterium vulneris TaxID=547163 RepID=A0A1X2KMX3_9MYCO|nr:hypothetical protein B8W69_25190 [Mycolicibacterium vulneris]